MPRDYTRADEDIVADIHAALKADIDKAIMTPPVPFTDASPYFLKLLGGPHLENTFLRISDLLLEYALAPANELATLIDPLLPRYQRTQRWLRYVREAVWPGTLLLIVLNYFKMLGVQGLVGSGTALVLLHGTAKFWLDVHASKHDWIAQAHALLHPAKSVTLGTYLCRARDASLLVRGAQAIRSAELHEKLCRSITAFKGTMHEHRTRYPG